MHEKREMWQELKLRGLVSSRLEALLIIKYTAERVMCEE